MRSKRMPLVRPRNAAFVELRSGKFGKRIVRARKGAGSYEKPSNRRPDERRDGGSDSAARRVTARGRGPAAARRAARR